MGLDQRIGSAFLRAGIGYGGSCFPKDVSALKQLAGNTGYHFQLLTAVIEVNELQKRRVMKKLEKHLGSLVGKKVALLGLAFKPDTDDMREATSLVLAARLQGEGASVQRLRPRGRARRRASCCRASSSATRPEQALEGADAAILVTEWPEFAELDWASLRERMANPLLIDGRNFLDPAEASRRRLRLRGDRAAERRRRGAGRRASEERRRREIAAALMQALVLVGRRGHPPAPPDADPSEAGAAAGRPSVHPLHRRLARPARGRRGRDGVRLRRRSAARGARRGRRAGPRIRYVEEPEPLGHRAGRCASPPTRGCSTNASWCSTATCSSDLDLGALIRGHEERGAVATLALPPVADPERLRPRSPRGRADGPRRQPASAEGEVLEFLEKPDPGADRHRRGQRRRLRARAQPDRARSRRAGWSRSSARSSRAWSARGCTVTGWRATGWTSAPPSATCRQAGTSSRAACGPPPARGSTAPGCWSRTARRSIPAPASSRRRCWRPRSRSAPARRSGPAP